MTDKQEYDLFCQTYALFLKESGREPEKPPEFETWKRRREQMARMKAILEQEIADRKQVGP